MGTFVPILMMLLSYLVGSIPVGYLIGKSKGIDIRSYGSHNIGATNASRTLGKGYGFIVFLLDYFKAGIFVIISKYLFNYQDDFFTIHIHPLIYGTLAILGHLFPIFLKFKGGKGISCFAGVITCYFWPLAVVGLITFVLVASITKYISVASTLGTLSLIIAYFIMQKNDMYLFIFLILTFILIIIKHIPNYKRLIHNEENKIKLFDKKS